MAMLTDKTAMHWKYFCKLGPKNRFVHRKYRCRAGLTLMTDTRESGRCTVLQDRVTTELQH